MSESGRNPQREPLESTITPVRRPVATDSGPAADERPGGWRLPLFSLAALLAVAGFVAVFGYLPGWVEEAEQEPPPPVVEAPAAPLPAEPALSAEEQARLTTLAESLLAELLEQKQALATRSVASWGDTTWSAYENAERFGSDALLAAEPQAAVCECVAALGMGRALLARSENIVAEALAAGAEALTSNDAELAASQFGLVLGIEPDNRTALNGIERAGTLPDVIAAMRRGDAHDEAGELQQAARAYRDTLAIDPEYTAARTALDSVNRRLAEASFARIITDGFAAIDARRFDAAAEHFRAALGMRPGSATATDGLAQAEQGLQMQAIEMAEVRGFASERTERWDEAIARYREALATDATLAFAIEGLERARLRADLDAKLQAVLDEPQTLLTQAGLQDGRLIFDEARLIAEPGPRLTAQIDELSQLIELAITPISVTLLSDNATEVTVYRVGQLGAFASLEVELTPGSYTAVGVRNGYYEVRERFMVLPGADNGPVTIVCVDPI
jgi:tetratricopeptide (TPR) repeat protein